MGKKNKSKKKAESPEPAADVSVETPAEDASAVAVETAPETSTNGTSLEDQVKALQEQLATTTKRLEVERDVAVKRSESEISALKEELDKVKSDQKPAEQDDSEVEELRKEMEGLRVQFGELEKEKDGLEKEKKELEKAKNELEKAKMELETSKKELESSKGSESTSDEVASEVASLKEQLEAKTSQYDSLLDRITQIKSTLGERLKSDAAELAETREKLENETQRREKETEKVTLLKDELIEQSQESKKLSQELTQARSKFQSEVDGLSRERDLLKREILVVQETCNKSQGASSKYEIALSELKNVNSDLENRNSGLLDEITAFKKNIQSLDSEKASLKSKLEKQTKDQSTSSGELEKQISEHKTVSEALKRDLDLALEESQTLQTNYKKLEEKLASSCDFEKESKDKSLLIGKLRHEAVILNEHLTNALQMIKKSSEGDTVDKQLVSNLILSFVSLSRGDTKKFEVLQLISNFLEWDEQEKVQAGLSRSSFATEGVERSASSTQLSGQGERQGAVGFFGKFAEFLDREASKK